MPCTFRGVTQPRIRSTPTGVDTGSAVFTAYGAGVAGLSGVDNGPVVLAKGKGLAATPVPRLAKASTSIVDRSCGRS